MQTEQEEKHFKTLKYYLWCIIKNLKQHKHKTNIYMLLQHMYYTHLIHNCTISRI